MSALNNIVLLSFLFTIPFNNLPFSGFGKTSFAGTGKQDTETENQDSVLISEGTDFVSVSMKTVSAYTDMKSAGAEMISAGMEIKSAGAEMMRKPLKIRFETSVSSKTEARSQNGACNEREMAAEIEKSLVAGLKSPVIARNNKRSLDLSGQTVATGA